MHLTFCQIFGGFSFASSGWALGCAVQVKMVGSHQGTVAPVSQWCDDQPVRKGRSKIHYNICHIKQRPADILGQK